MLHIRKIALSSFATHNKTETPLPVKGLLTIRGGNGSGKSSLLEGVATALWGDSLRGEMGWRDGEAGIVAVTSDQLTALRKRSKAGSSKLEWVPLDGEAVTYETSSKAQAALESMIGSFDVWRRTCVLSSLDSAAFSLARDSDRKRLLEEFLGLGMFDTALDACRKDRRAAAAKAQQAEAERKEVALRLTFAEQQLRLAKQDQSAMLAETDGMDLAALKDEGKKMADLVAAAAKDVEKARTRVNNAQAANTTLWTKVRHEQDRLSHLKDQCPACGQNTTHAKEALAAEVSRLKREAAESSAKIEQEFNAAKDDLADLQAEHTALSDKLAKLREQFALASSQAKQREALLTKISAAEKAVDEWSAKAKTQASTSDTAAKEAAHLEAVEQVLGLRGVRAQVLDHALSALESQANAWLARMPTDQGALSISLTGSTTQKSGNVVDAISLKVRGRSYASCSGGERRRVDVALLLALRELAVAAHGRDGTLFCDEVFDALDQQGQADVAAALREMAEDRLVVVITHSPDLVTALRPDVQLHVALKDGSAAVTSHR